MALHIKWLLAFLILATFGQAARIWLPQSLMNDYRNEVEAQDKTLEDTIDGLLVGLRRQLKPPLEYSTKFDWLAKKQQENWNNNNNHNHNESFISTKRSARLNDEVSPQIAYVISPLSEQILPISSDKLSQGYRDFVPLADTYKLGLQKLSTSYPLADNELNVDQQQQQQQQSDGSGGGGCRTLRSTIALERDDVDKTSGRILRTCRGLVQLNRCEGSCPSSVQPSIKSRSGFKKNCSCCNEATFRKVQVRLSECTLSPAVAADNQQQESLLLSGGAVKGSHENLPTLLMGNLAQDSKSSGQLGSIDSMMDIEVDEPIECKCRQCDSAL